MKKDFRLFTTDSRGSDERNKARMIDFTNFLNYLAKQRKKFTVTVFWADEIGYERGFVVWFNR